VSSEDHACQKIGNAAEELDEPSTDAEMGGGVFRVDTTCEWLVTHQGIGFDTTAR
jgi:hypothetical protein